MQKSKKRHAFGQHFLVAPNLIQQILEAVKLLGLAERRPKAVLEIGPGTGALTHPFIQTVLPQLLGNPRFLLSEKDRDFASEWKDRGLKVLEGDFLDLPPEAYLDVEPLLVFSNLPYASGTAILNRLADSAPRICGMVLMFQAEVAQRIRAEPNDSAWGSLSLWIQNRWNVELLVEVPPDSFSPPPQVNSEVLILTPRAEPRLNVSNSVEGLNRLNRILRLAFSQRRKMLRGLLPIGTPERIAFDQSGLDGTKRAEALSWDEWDRWLKSYSAG